MLVAMHTAYEETYYKKFHRNKILCLSVSSPLGRCAPGHGLGWVPALVALSLFTRRESRPTTVKHDCEERVIQ